MTSVTLFCEDKLCNVDLCSLKAGRHILAVMHRTIQHCTRKHCTALFSELEWFDRQVARHSSQIR